MLKPALEEITNKMRNAYFEEAGELPIQYSDADNRIKAAATELYSVCSYADYIFRQAFVQTATGAYLDYHAGLRGLERKKAGKAKGKLRFYITSAIEENAVIPKGTICSLPDKPFVQFETTESTVIYAGMLFAEAAAAAVETGEKFNVSAEEIRVIVNPPKYVSGVINDSAFEGGMDDETDEGLRQRLLSMYKYESNALNEESVRGIVLSCSDVRDAYIAVNGKAFYLTLKMRYGSYVDLKTQQEIKQKLSFLKILGLELYMQTAKEKAFNADVDIKAYSGADFDEIKQQAENRIKDYCGTEKIGKEMRAYDLARALADMPELYDVHIMLSPSVSGSAVCGTTEYLKLKELKVTVHEQ